VSKDDHDEVSRGLVIWIFITSLFNR